MRKTPLLLLLALLPWAGVAVLATEPAAADACLSCHEQAVTRHPASPHFKAPVLCGSCHGDGARHAETGEAKLIRGFKGGQPAAAVCTTCHTGQHITEWKASRHYQVGVDCVDCHTVHLVKDVKESCKGCH